MAISITIAPHPATVIRSPTSSSSTTYPLQILTHLLPSTRPSLIQSSFQSSSFPPVLLPDRNGFVHTITTSYNKHHHVTIRPDDVWMAIISQFSFYVNAHAEELREKFVAHQGKVELEVVYNQGDRFMVDIAYFTDKIGALLEQSIVDEGLRKWTLPAFTTTTQDDVVAASVVMMGTMQAYFSYSMHVCCGIPSVTLLGEKRDYEEMLRRVTRLGEYGEEAMEFGKGLVPVLEGMVRTFEEGERSEEVKRFWETVCDYHSGSGMDHYSGWITAFCFWRANGNRVGGGNWVHRNDIPVGFTKVPLHINDHGEEIEAEMLAGSVAVICSSSGRMSLAASPNHYTPGIGFSRETTVGIDSMQPHIGWFLYEK
ncbi:hypothetical protein B0H66DRAFT_565943 [Apodospora peruviana]|uniref:Uncharacterized protein n=1 Tax=Apodospora peruviana TaxID=516989 RepID=A0AAE0LZG1_9PEZI|nr:hypothetical protein B0H66DRAFT_565943 [Apodospora peruviana]